MATLGPRWNGMKFPLRAVPSLPAGSRRCSGRLPRRHRSVLMPGAAGLVDRGIRSDRFIEEFRGRVADVLGMTPEKVDPDRPLLTMGLDSLSAVDLKVDVESSLGVTLALSSLLEGATIRDLAEQAAAQGARPSNEPAEPAAAAVPEAMLEHPALSEPLSGESGQPLSHQQQMLWYAHQFTRLGRRLPRHRSRIGARGA